MNRTPTAEAGAPTPVPVTSELSKDARYQAALKVVYKHVEGIATDASGRGNPAAAVAAFEAGVAHLVAVGAPAEEARSNLRALIAADAARGSRPSESPARAAGPPNSNTRWKQLAAVLLVALVGIGLVYWYIVRLTGRLEAQPELTADDVAKYEANVEALRAVLPELEKQKTEAKRELTALDSSSRAVVMAHVRWSVRTKVEEGPYGFFPDKETWTWLQNNYSSACLDRIELDRDRAGEKSIHYVWLSAYLGYTKGLKQHLSDLESFEVVLKRFEPRGEPLKPKTKGDVSDTTLWVSEAQDLVSAWKRKHDRGY